MLGPVGSDYPGTPITLALACLSAFIFVRAMLSVFRQRRDVRSRHTRGADAIVAVVAAYLFATMLWAVWLASTVLGAH